MTYYARLSKEWGVEAFTIGQELSGTDHQTHRWLETIAAVRDVYSGWVCLNALKTNRDKPAFIEWVRALDAVGFSNYEGVPEPKPTLGGRVSNTGNGRNNRTAPTTTSPTATPASPCTESPPRRC